MMTILRWRNCVKCWKSYDAIYAGWFGCRACKHTEPV